MKEKTEKLLQSNNLNDVLIAIELFEKLPKSEFFEIMEKLNKRGYISDLTTYMIDLNIPGSSSMERQTYFKKIHEHYLAFGNGTIVIDNEQHMLKTLEESPEWKIKLEA